MDELETLKIQAYQNVSKIDPWLTSFESAIDVILMKVQPNMEQVRTDKLSELYKEMEQSGGSLDYYKYIKLL